MDEEKEFWEKLLSENQGLSPERREQLSRERQKVADDPDITPEEAFRRGVVAGAKAIGEDLLDHLETFAAFRTAFPKDKGKS